MTAVHQHVRTEGHVKIKYMGFTACVWMAMKEPPVRQTQLTALETLV